MGWLLTQSHNKELHVLCLLLMSTFHSLLTLSPILQLSKQHTAPSFTHKKHNPNAKIGTKHLKSDVAQLSRTPCIRQDSLNSHSRLLWGFFGETLNVLKGSTWVVHFFSSWYDAINHWGLLWKDETTWFSKVFLK